MVRTMVVAGTFLVAASCGSSSDSVTNRSTTLASSTAPTSTVMSTTTAPAVPTVPPVTVSAACPTPYEPWWSYNLLPSTLPVDPPMSDEELSGPYAPPEPGTVHYVDEDRHGYQVVIRRPEGDVMLTSHGEELWIGDDLGDLDGDGRDETMVGVNRPPDGPEQWTVFIVRGSTAAGAYDLATIGTRFLHGLPVGDQNGDGVGDLEVRTDPASDGQKVMLISGREVLAAGIGGDSRNVQPFRRIDNYVAVARLSGTTPTIVTGSVHDGIVDLTLELEPRMKLRSVISSVQSPRSPPFGVRAFRSGGDRIVQYEESDRSGTRYWAWNLDHPCSRR